MNENQASTKSNLLGKTMVFLKAQVKGFVSRSTQLVQNSIFEYGRGLIFQTMAIPYINY